MTFDALVLAPALLPALGVGVVLVGDAVAPVRRAPCQRTARDRDRPFARPHEGSEDDAELAEVPTGVASQVEHQPAGPERLESPHLFMDEDAGVLPREARNIQVTGALRKQPADRFSHQLFRRQPHRLQRDLESITRPVDLCDQRPGVHGILEPLRRGRSARPRQAHSVHRHQGVASHESGVFRRRAREDALDDHADTGEVTGSHPEP